MLLIDLNCDRFEAMLKDVDVSMTARVALVVAQLKEAAPQDEVTDTESDEVSDSVTVRVMGA